MFNSPQLFKQSALAEDAHALYGHPLRIIPAGSRTEGPQLGTEIFLAHSVTT